MKVSEGKVAWINSTPLDDFATKASSPPSQKQNPEYTGKKFIHRVVFVIHDGELMIAGQNYTTKTKEDAAGNEVVEWKYKDLILAHFDNKGILKRSYGIRRDKMNKWAKAIISPIDLYVTPDGKHLFWVHGGIKGMRQGFAGDFLGSQVTISKKMLLYYPAVAKVDLEKATISDFQYLGANEEGKQIYFTDPNVNQVMSADGRKLIFVGENKAGILVWLAKMNME